MLIWRVNVALPILGHEPTVRNERAAGRWAQISSRRWAQTLRLDREFNLRAGFTAADNRLPKWMTREPLSPHNAIFDVSEIDLDTIFDES